ncbi:CHAP domain-containing protein [uncultured Flavobacterium sp.]|uniref:CHAP domain-containing protein n=1 Tax=uncultured Flavobacterium sp. TaxID=165435 RepID=UPI0025FA22F9|nr:CHAP domain-containing protein [uncultured Flavobacterium sp.]
MKLSQKSLEIAISQIGQKEKPLGSNWGEPVKSYLASVGISFPASWCMAFIYWCFKNASEDLKVKNTAIKTGGVLKAWNDAPKEIKDSVPSIGSVFIMDYGKGLGHTGIVEKFDSTNIYTIEGNTNDTGSREGIEVCRKVRKRSAVKGYLNY